MQKVFLVDQGRCRACRTCELACSFFKEKECNPAKSRIHAERWEDEHFLGKNLTRVCQQCTPPTCKAVCPSGAITLNQDTGAIMIDQSSCTKCGLCIRECPYGSLRRDRETEVPFVCDLCGGRPKCVEWCPAGAIQYLPATWSNLMKKREASMALLSLVREAAEHKTEG